MSLLGNSLVVTIAKTLISKFAFPPLSYKLAQLRFGIKGAVVISNYELAVMVNRVQANSLLLFDIGSVLLAPMIAVFVFDDSCLRFYLSFVGELRQIMDAWYIGQQGHEVYRPRFC